MAKQGPRGGGRITAGIRLRVRGHGLVSDTLGAMNKEIEFDRAGASFRRRRKRASTDQNLPPFMPTSAKSVVEAATILLLAFSVIFGLVFCAPTLPAASFQQARECRGLVISRTSPISTDGALRRGTSAIILEAAGSGDAPNATSLGRSSLGAGMHVVPRTSASTQNYTSIHRMQRHKQPTSLDLHQQLCLLDAEPPIIVSSRRDRTYDCIAPLPAALQRV